MRRFVAILLLVAGAASGDHLVETGRVQYSGSPVGLAAMAAGEGYLPAVQTLRSSIRGQFRVLNLMGGSLYETKQGGTSLGIARHGGGVVTASMYSGEVHLYEFYEEVLTQRARARYHGAVNVQGYRHPRLLHLGSATGAPLVVLGHAGGLVVATVKPAGQGTTDLIARPGRSYVAVTAPFHAERNGRLDMFAVGSGRLLHIEQAGRGFQAKGEAAFTVAGFKAHAIAGSTRQLWVGGNLGDRAGLLFFLPHRVAQAAAARGPQALTPAGIVPLGRGRISHVRVLDPTHVVVAGSKDGRAWVGVVESRPRPVLVHEAFLSGTDVTAIGLNPARTGWTIGACTPDKSIHLLRVPGDKPLPRDWDPFAQPDYEEVPEKVPTPDQPVPTPDQPAPDQPVEDEIRELPGADPGRRPHRRADEGLLAILPRVAASRRESTDTEIVLVYLGTESTIMSLRFVENDGNLLKTVRFRLRPGQRGRISVRDEVGRRRGGFDGYVLVEGCRRRDLVVEGVVRRGTGDAERTEALAAHWR